MQLPNWVTDNTTSVLEEAAPYRAMSKEQRVLVLRNVMRVGATQMAMHADRERLLAWRDPLPKTSNELLERLRREYREQHGRAT